MCIYAQVQQRRVDCERSGKGGKRPENSRFHYDRNPCYCHANATCISRLTNEVYMNGTVPCPVSEDVYCLGADKNEIKPWVSELRNCNGGLGDRCTAAAPCSPCEASTLAEFSTSRCQSCASDNLVSSVIYLCYHYYLFIKFLINIGRVCAILFLVKVHIATIHQIVKRLFLARAVVPIRLPFLILMDVVVNFFHFNIYICIECMNCD